MEGERLREKDGDLRYEPAMCQALCGFLINCVALSLIQRRSQPSDSDRSSGSNSRSVRCLMVGETQDAREGCLNHTCGEGSAACPVSGQEAGEGQRETTPDGGKQLVEIRGMTAAWSMGPIVSICVLKHQEEGEWVRGPLEG